jgi:hypothetical protein
MLFEDVQWIDATSNELLDLAVARVARWSVLLLITCRPEFTPPWTGQPQVTVLTLNRLDRREGAALVARVLGNETLPGDLVEEIVERTDGVPLFTEELTKAVLEAGGANAETALSTTAPAVLAVPPTLHASLMARLDRLGPAAKQVGQIGAAIGREFPYELLIAVTDQTADELRAALDRLADAGLVFRRGMPPDASYTFKHALVQDAAYSTLLRGPRQQLHTRIAAALEQRFPEVAQTQPEVLARHCTEAGLVDPAVLHWQNAGEQAVQRAANRESIAHFRRALSLNAARPDGVDRRRTEVAILSQLGPALGGVHGWGAPEAGAAVERAVEVARQLESSVDLVPPLAGLWVFHEAHGQFARVEAISAELFRIARELDDPEILLQAHHSAWPNRFRRGVPGAAASTSTPAWHSTMKNGTSDTAISISGTIRPYAPWRMARSCSGCLGTRNEPFAVSATRASWRGGYGTYRRWHTHSGALVTVRWHGATRRRSSPRGRNCERCARSTGHRTIVRGHSYSSAGRWHRALRLPKARRDWRRASAPAVGWATAPRCRRGSACLRRPISWAGVTRKGCSRLH